MISGQPGSRIGTRVVVAVAVALLAGTPAGAGDSKKTFRDVRSAVVLEYPRSWRVDAGLRFQPRPVILGALGAEEQPLLRVGFGPGDAAFAAYRKTTLVGAEFVAVVVEGGSAQTCRERLDISGFKSGASNENGVRYGWTVRSDQAAGETTTQKVYAAYRMGRCYLYEEDVHEAIVPAAQDGHPLRDDEREAVMHDLEAVMGSVRYAGGPER